jgi:hypothetical protein
MGSNERAIVPIDIQEEKNAGNHCPGGATVLLMMPNSKH